MPDQARLRRIRWITNTTQRLKKTARKRPKVRVSNPNPTAPAPLTSVKRPDWPPRVPEKHLSKASPSSTTKTTPLAAEDFKKAATRHARSVSGRGKIADMKKPRTTAQTEERPTTPAQEPTGAGESIAYARRAPPPRRTDAPRLRITDSNGWKTPAPPRPGNTSTFEDGARIEEACARLEDSLARATQVEERLNDPDLPSGGHRRPGWATASRSATPFRPAPRNGPERSPNSKALSNNAVTRSSNELRPCRLEWKRPFVASKRWTVRSNRANAERAPPATPAVTLKQEPPVIEIHARTPPTQSTGAARRDQTRASEPDRLRSRNTARRAQASTDEDDHCDDAHADSDEQFSRRHPCQSNPAEPMPRHPERHDPRMFPAMCALALAGIRRCLHATGRIRPGPRTQD